jgi:hypothetical protein
MGCYNVAGPAGVALLARLPPRSPRSTRSARAHRWSRCDRRGGASTGEARVMHLTKMRWRGLPERCGGSEVWRRRLDNDVQGSGGPLVVSGGGLGDLQHRRTKGEVREGSKQRE